jgi:hypothetical protein
MDEVKNNERKKLATESHAVDNILNTRNVTRGWNGGRLIPNKSCHLPYDPKCPSLTALREVLQTAETEPFSGHARMDKTHKTTLRQGG